MYITENSLVYNMCIYLYIVCIPCWAQNNVFHNVLGKFVTSIHESPTQLHQMGVGGHFEICSLAHDPHGISTYRLSKYDFNNIALL